MVLFDSCRLFSSSVVRGRSVRWCFLGQWLWTNEFAAVRSRNFATLVALLVRAVCIGKNSTEVCFGCQNSCLGEADVVCCLMGIYMEVFCAARLTLLPHMAKIFEW